MALAIRTHIISQLLRKNLIVCLHFLIYKLPTNNNGCVLVGWCDVSECADTNVTHLADQTRTVKSYGQH